VLVVATGEDIVGKSKTPGPLPSAFSSGDLDFEFEFVSELDPPPLPPPLGFNPCAISFSSSSTISAPSIIAAWTNTYCLKL